MAKVIEEGAISPLECAVSVKSYAKIMNVTAATIYNEAKRGRLKITKLAGRSIILPADRQAYEASLGSLYAAA